MTAGRGITRAVLLVLVGLALVVAAGEAPALAAGPTVTIDKPLAGSWTKDSRPPFSGTTDDLEDEVTLKIYAGASAVEPPLHAAPGVTGTWAAAPSSPLADGPYTAVAEQTNGASGLGTSGEVKFTVDTAVPAVEITTPVANAILGTSTPTFGGVAGHADGDLGSVTLKIFVGTVVSGPLSEMLTQVELASVGDSWSTGLPGVPLPDGIYTAVAEQSDAAGNVGKSRVTFAISAPASPPAGAVPAAASPSRSAPVASFQWFPSTPHVGEPVSLVSTSTDLSSPINAVAWDLAGSGAFAGGSSIVTTSFSTPGAHVVQLRVTDTNGLSSVVAHTITVAAARPSLIQPFPVVRIAGSEGSAGVRISLLTVQTPAGARVRVACRGRGCPSKRVQVLAAARGRGGGAGMVLIEFRRFERSLRAGAYLEIRVSTPTEIGKYTRFTVRRGRLPARVDMCLAPAGVKPIACPSS